ADEVALGVGQLLFLYEFTAETLDLRDDALHGALDVDRVDARVCRPESTSQARLQGAVDVIGHPLAFPDTGAEASHEPEPTEDDVGDAERVVVGISPSQGREADCDVRLALAGDLLLASHAGGWRVDRRDLGSWHGVS